MSWVSVSCRGSDTRAPCSVSLCECVVSSLLGHTLFCPPVFCGVARSSCYYRLRAFMLCLVLCGTQLVYFIGCVLSCCHVLCEHVDYEFSLAACSCPVLHMAGELFAGHVLVFFCFVWIHGFCPGFLCPMCSHVNCLDPTHLVYLICPTCLPSLPSSFAPFIISLCLQSCASSSSFHHRMYPIMSCPVLPCPVLWCLAKLASYGVVFFCFLFVYFIRNKAHLLHYWVLASSLLPSTLTVLRCVLNYFFLYYDLFFNFKRKLTFLRIFLEFCY